MVATTCEKSVAGTDEDAVANSATPIAFSEKTASLHPGGMVIRCWGPLRFRMLCIRTLAGMEIITVWTLAIPGNANQNQMVTNPRGRIILQMIQMCQNDTVEQNQMVVSPRGCIILK